MQNRSLAKDYVFRAGKRLLALRTLFEAEDWADVVREAQETVELALKGLLRSAAIEVPRIHDVSAVLEKELQRLPEAIRGDVPALVAISRTLRRDRELAFYGSEDLTPSEFYTREDAEGALAKARQAVKLVAQVVS